MKNITGITLVLSLLFACRTASSPSPSPNPRPSASQTTSHSSPPHAPSTVPSLYDLALRLRTADDRTVGLDVARGHVVLVSMFYGTCPAACPVLVEEIDRVLAAALGIKYRKLADGSFSHNIAVVALDADGRPLARMDRLGDDAALEAVLR